MLLEAPDPSLLRVTKRLLTRLPSSLCKHQTIWAISHQEKMSPLILAHGSTNSGKGATIICGAIAQLFQGRSASRKPAFRTNVTMSQQ